MICLYATLYVPVGCLRDSSSFYQLHFVQQHSAKKSFEDGPTLQHTLPANEKQAFSFTTTVSWTFLEPKYETVKSPPPTLLFSVPYDVFYPFQMNSGVVVRRSLVWTSLVAVCTITVVGIF